MQTEKYIRFEVDHPFLMWLCLFCSGDSRFQPESKYLIHLRHHGCHFHFAHYIKSL